MRRLCAFVLLLHPLWSASNDPSEILGRLRQNLGAQLERDANYTCVQTTERIYFRLDTDAPTGCPAEPNLKNREEFLQDRLRLDVAVSKGNEIYSWHGENKFSSGTIANIVRNGPISSGNFIGFLRNIFFMPGIRFDYRGTAAASGASFYRFNYVVPLENSRYNVEGEKGARRVAFHGSFTVNSADDQLASLQVIADSIPADSPLCTAETTVDYQLVNISGRMALIPATFVLDVTNRSHVYTTSRNRYAQCREFRGESKLFFDRTAPASQPATAGAAHETLPANLTLHIALKTLVDDRSSYAGDRVEGVLLNPVAIPGTDKIIPKGATADGILVRLEHFNDPFPHSLASIQFQRIMFADHSFVLNAWPKTSDKSRQALSEVYDGHMPSNISAYAQQGLLASKSSHLHLAPGFSADWVTAKLTMENTETQSQ